MPNDNSEIFFPNQNIDSIHLEESFRRIVQNCAEFERYSLYAWIAKVHASYESFQFNLSDKFLHIKQDGSDFSFPRPVPMVIMSHIIFGYKEWLKRKYALPGFVEVEYGDLVVDCGGYIGGFSLSASDKASRIYIFEPDELNYECCKINFYNSDTVNVENVGLYKYSTDLTFNVSHNSVEHSLLTPDDGIISRKRVINVVSLSDFCAQNNVTHVDFLKLEAEGVEQEVFEGLGDILPKKIAIDISPERNNESPFVFFRDNLLKNGYDIKRRKNVLFAKLNHDK